MIFLSSYMYGLPERLPIDEEHPTGCRNPYATSKFLGVELCRSYARDFGVNVDILRLFNPYGPGQGPNSLIETVLEQALGGEEIIVEDLDPKRDYIYLADCISAILALIGRATNGCRVFNLGSGKSHSVREVVDLVLKITGRDLPVSSRTNQRANEIPDCYADTRRLFEASGWRPRFGLEEGLRETLKDRIPA